MDKGQLIDTHRATGSERPSLNDDLEDVHARAVADGYVCAVGAVIVDEDGRAFSPRRTSRGSSLPGLWDLVGGHVEPGESLLDALRREVFEETGWVVAGSPILVFASSWDAVCGGQPHRHREFDFQVRVTGDLTAPRLHPDEHDEFRWLAPDQLDLLDENEGRDEGLIRRVLEVGLRSAVVDQLTYPHITLFASEPAARELNEIRRVWDPAMARRIAPHVTVAYPHEVDSVDDAVNRLTALARAAEPFDMELLSFTHDGDPDRGVFVELRDLHGRWRELRSHVADDLADEMPVRPHITMVHPRTSNLGARFWASLPPLPTLRTVRFDTVCVTAFDGVRWQTVAEAPLSAKGRSPTG